MWCSGSAPGLSWSAATSVGAALVRVISSPLASWARLVSGPRRCMVDCIATNVANRLRQSLTAAATASDHFCSILTGRKSERRSTRVLASPVNRHACTVVLVRVCLPLGRAPDGVAFRAQVVVSSCPAHQSSTSTSSCTDRYLPPQPVDQQYNVLSTYFDRTPRILRRFSTGQLPSASIQGD